MDGEEDEEVHVEGPDVLDLSFMFNLVELETNQPSADEEVLLRLQCLHSPQNSVESNVNQAQFAWQHEFSLLLQDPARNEAESPDHGRWRIYRFLRRSLPQKLLTKSSANPKDFRAACATGSRRADTRNFLLKAHAFDGAICKGENR